MHSQPAARPSPSNWLYAVLLTALAFPGAAGPAAAQDAPAPVPSPSASPKAAPPRRTFALRPASGPIRVDGVLDEEAWAAATPIPLEYEWQPGDNTAPVQKTDCLVTFDAERLYLGFRAFDSDPDGIRAHLADRDTPFQDDTVGFMVDPFNDERRAFQFRVNPLGVQMDATNSDVDNSEDWSWDAIWESRGRIGADGYVVEVSIPFSSLRFPRGTSVQTWGFVATRDFPRSLRHRMRSAWTDRDKACLVCQFDKVTGLGGMRPGRNLEFAPTLTAHRTDARTDFPGGGLEGGAFDLDPGLTARWGITPSLVLNAAVNPDFSQVEADVAQLDINTRFALFFPEKRPLFLEGADLFATPITTVFTRTVADPRWGIKLTGKQGRSALGAFFVRDAVNNLLIPGNQGSALDTVDQGLWSGVLRYRRDEGRTSNVGLTYTAREADGYHNRLGSLDGRIRFSDADSVRFQLLLSSTEYPRAVAEAHAQPRGGFGGAGAFADYQHGTRNWFWFTEAGGLSPDLRADSGFVTRVDTRWIAAGAERTFWAPATTWYSRIQLGFFADRSQDWSGRVTDWGLDFPITYHGPRQVLVSYNPAPNFELFEGVGYHNFRHNITLETRPSGSLAFSMNATLGKTVDFANSRQADMVRLAPLVEFSLARGVNGELRHNFQRLEVEGGRRLFTANLTELRLVYHMNLRTFVRAILQYTDIARDPALYRAPIEPRTRELFTQALFSYKLNPQTVVLLGYSDNHLGLRGVDLTQTDRTFFFKIGYAWVL